MQLGESRHLLKLKWQSSLVAIGVMSLICWKWMKQSGNIGWEVCTGKRSRQGEWKVQPNLSLTGFSFSYEELTLLSFLSTWQRLFLQLWRHRPPNTCWSCAAHSNRSCILASVILEDSSLLILCLKLGTGCLANLNPVSVTSEEW